MAILFISDLHLSPATPTLTQAFIALLQQAHAQAEQVYILGDLFDRWIGDDDDAAYLIPIITAFQQLTQQVPCYFVAGNRDFLLGADFACKTGITILQEPVIMDLYGQKTELLHGDILCTDDRRYQRYRKIVRNRAILHCYLSMPLWLRKAIAAFLRRESQHYQAHNTLFSANQNAILHEMQKQQVNLLIFGHIHQPGMHYMVDGSSWRQWIVLGDWHDDKTSALWAYPDGRLVLIH